MNAIATPIAVATLSFAALPALGAELDGGTFQGIATRPDGQHVAVVYLGHADQDRNHKNATAWAAELGGVLATRAVFNLLLATLGTPLPPNCYWTSETYGSSYAWYCYSNGIQYDCYRSSSLGAVAVRLIPLVL